ncbi:hypothetical protein [Ralstonia solanacearum]|uniref:hypothetical protein n=1 Tax=Ralstonia solanacearum TaxID=305 RepID=UPI00130159E5|nr:hypothetical protein [Ralstonia solanacearum]
METADDQRRSSFESFGAVTPACNDPLTRGSEALAENWKRLNVDLHVRRLPDGGHYFLKTRIPLLSDMLCEQLKPA